MKCNLCIEKEKTWAKNNSHIKCAFSEGIFSSDNWNCGTMDILRDKAEKNALWNNDNYASLIPYDIDDYNNGFLYIEWYKSRGGTDLLINMADTEKPVNLEFINKIIGK